VSPAGSYRRRARNPSQGAEESGRLAEKIKAVHAAGRGIYGSPKIYRCLRREGERVNHQRVERLMKGGGIKAKRVKKVRRTTDSRHSSPVAENVLSRVSKTARPDGVRATDITYARTAGGWLYLVVFLDLYSRPVVGRAASESLEVGFVEAAFVRGQQRRGRAASPLVHSDRGGQHASDSFRERLSAWGCRQSVSRKGNCRDNAVTESCFGVPKNEMSRHERFRTRQEAQDKIFDHIEIFYNRSRIRSASGYFAPAEYEAGYRAQLKEAA